MAALAATVTASMAPSALSKPQRATMPVSSALLSNLPAGSTPADAQPAALLRVNAPSPVNNLPANKPASKVGTLPPSRQLLQPSALIPVAAPSIISRSSKLREVHPLDKLFSSKLATRPDTAPAVPKAVVAEVVAPQTTDAPKVGSTNSAPAVTVKPLVATTNPTVEAKTNDQVLLAQIDAQLKETESQLKSTDDKLSEGQRQLLGLSTTLRSVMLEDQDAVGLHPFVRVAARYAGTPYVWGGESRYGFDCSGFIIRVMRDLGYHALPHSAAEQFKYGKPIAQAMLRPGDLVFFANTYKPGISHVGIYIGKRRFIHAASTRQGTIVSSLDTQPYSRKYAGARRLVAVGRRA
jgi:cell wall-associated NlpC family hydrolase